MSSIDAVFVDESGYTGADLLNRDQRFHCVAAVRASANRADQIVSENLSGVAAPELKFSSLVRRPLHRQAAIAAIHDLTQQDGAVGYVYCKRYALWLRLLDDCVEPVHYRHGIPYYANGWNRTLASLLFFTSGTVWGEARRDAILTAYQAVVRGKTQALLSAFLSSLAAIRGCQLSEFFALAMLGDKDVVACLLNPQGTLDLSYSLANGLITWLETHTTAPYQIVHDTNKAIGAALSLFEKTTAISEPATFRVSNNAQLTYPLKCRSVGMADSRADRRLQLADILAGGVRLAAEGLTGAKPDDGFATALLTNLPHDALIFNLPSLDFEETRRVFEGTDGRHIDFIARHLSDRSRGT